MTIDSKVEFAWGADLTANPATWVWTDESVYSLGSVRIEYGAQDESGQTQPSSARIRLRNTDSRFSPRHTSSPHYPYVRQWTPIRISQDPGTGLVQRFQGEVDEILPVWPSGEEGYAEVEITARGVLTRLGQGDEALRSAPARWIPTTSPVAYWPLEDGQAAGAAEPLAGTSKLAPYLGQYGATTIVSYPTFGQATLAPWLPPVLGRSGAAGVTILYSYVNMTGFSTTWTVDLMYASGTNAGSSAVDDVAAAVDINPSYLNGGSAGWPQLQFLPSTVNIGVSIAGDATVFQGNRALYDGKPHHIRWTCTQSGFAVAYTVYVDGAAALTGTSVNFMTLTAVTSIGLTAAADSNVAQAHVAIWTSPPTLATAVSAATGWADETAGARITRLCGEEGITSSVSSTTGTAVMGPQAPNTLATLLRECETADGGILYDGRGAGVTYLAAQDRMCLSATVALDCQRQHVKLPFAPVENSQIRRNRWTVSRLNGGSATFTDTEDVAAYGGVVQSGSASINAGSDAVLRDEAGWRANLSTVEEMRVPGLTLELIDHPELWASWLAMTPGKRITCDNLPAQYPPGTLDMALAGAVEVWDPTSWRIEANTAPYAPWRVAQFAADTGDTSEWVGRFDTDGCTLAAGITAAATTALVSSVGAPWTTVADDLPFDVGIGGQRNRVTAVAATVSDTFGRTSASSWGSEPTSGAAYTCVGGSASDFSVGSGVGKQSLGTVAVLRTSHVDIGVTDVEYTVDVSVPPVVATGANITQWICGRLTDANNYYGVVLTLDTIGAMSLGIYKRVAGVATQLYPLMPVTGPRTAGDMYRVRLSIQGSTIRANAWIPARQADSGAWFATVTDTSITGGTRIGVAAQLETGNTNTLPVVVSWDNLSVTSLQQMTMTRAVNGVTKAHSASAPVSLWAPLVFAK